MNTPTSVNYGYDDNVKDNRYAYWLKTVNSSDPLNL